MSRPTRSVWAVMAALLVFAAGNMNSQAMDLPAAQPRDGPVEPPPFPTLIFGTDARQLVEDTTAFPWSAVGQVRAYYEDEIRVGTGAMIGDRAVLTSAHLVHEPGRSLPESVEFTPARNGYFEPFGRSTAAVQVVPRAWQDERDDQSDIAILILAEPLGAQSRFLPLEVLGASDLRDLPIRSAGYPSDLGTIYQYQATGQSLGTDGNFLIETLDTEPGQSGSPIWYTDPDSGEPRVVAVLKGTRRLTSGLGQTTSEGIAIRITPQWATWINQVLVTYGEQPQERLIGVEAMPMYGMCGLGLSQALLACALGWGTCLVSRRTRRIDGGAPHGRGSCPSADRCNGLSS